MTHAFSGLADDATPDPAASSSLASWYTPGLSDGLGDRLLMFDNTTASPLELLRFRPEFSGAPGFEAALRDRVDELASFDHPSLAQVRAVKWLGDGDGLTLVSNQIVGKRLSEILGEVQGTNLAVELIRQLCPVLAALHERGVAHGVLTPERIVITPDGRVVLTEHVLGLAMDSLKMPCGWMRTNLGLAVPSGNGRIELDGRSDVVQLGFIALSLAVGQRLQAADYPERVGLLIGDSGGAIPPGLRRWLERSLHLVWPPFASALEGVAALEELPEHREPARPDQAAAKDTRRLADKRPEPGANVIAIRPNINRPGAPEPAAPQRPEATAATPASTTAPPVVPVAAPVEPFFPDETQLPQSPPPAPRPVVTVERQPDRFRESPTADARVGSPDPSADADLHVRAAQIAGRDLSVAEAKIRETPAERRPDEDARFDVEIAFADENEPAPRAPVLEARQRAATSFSPQMLQRAAFGDDAVEQDEPERWSILTSKWFVAAVLTVALLEAVVIAGLLFSRAPSSTELAAAQSAPAEPAPDAVTSLPADQPASRRDTVQRSVHATNAAAGGATPARNTTPDTERRGSVRFNSPIALDVYANGTRIGNTSSPLQLSAGRHTLELINEPLSYRATQNVTVTAGRTVSRDVPLPQGRLNINALPWAHVTVDGKPVGETPLANLSMPIGPHEVTFRHPMLGEKRETAIVKVDTVTRVSVNMQR